MGRPRRRGRIGSARRTGRIGQPNRARPNGGAAVLILDQSLTKCVAISRGRDRQDWNLPGGHCEGSEDAIHAAVRELEEETGIMVTPSNLSLVYQQGTANVFMAADFFRWPPELASEPFEGHVAWQPLEVVCRPSCTFHQHARRLFSQLGLR